MMGREFEEVACTFDQSKTVSRNASASMQDRVGGPGRIRSLMQLLPADDDCKYSSVLDVFVYRYNVRRKPLFGMSTLGSKGQASRGAISSPPSKGGRENGLQSTPTTLLSYVRVHATGALKWCKIADWRGQGCAFCLAL